MAKKSTNDTEIKQEYSDLKFKENTLRIYPFPPGMHDLIMSQAIDENPLPEPPEKEIKSFAGSETKPETVLDFDNPEYVKAKKEAEDKREKYMSERILLYTLKNCCEVVDTKKMQSDIEMLADIIFFSDNEKVRMHEYIKAHVLKSKNDYESVIQTAIALSIVDEAEVAEAIKSFQS